MMSEIGGILVKGLNLGEPDYNMIPKKLEEMEV
jgi:hypothetical protein